MGLRMKSCSIMRILWKIRFLGGSRKTSIKGELSKRGRGGQLADLRGGLAKKRGGGVVFLRGRVGGWYPNAHYGKSSPISNSHFSHKFCCSLIFRALEIITFERLQQNKAMTYDFLSISSFFHLRYGMLLRSS